MEPDSWKILIQYVVPWIFDASSKRLNFERDEFGIGLTEHFHSETCKHRVCVDGFVYTYGACGYYGLVYV